ncbi:pentatricopeptide repeat-containing chloroplastic [Chlorella sorokiniana]|uniref:Pentatricopeptide repeat-containing chloroplastic n=1 Tax=Chlorella sorokiniana TaxID=3076 RepID=A0A2P6TTN3_CHLSO|nr:pentatricopeptide repeat-containing chloroplastic [Chlorella sorokiniana]|eukprot:PRW57431.1 pentatricopeptide repeat-containing chloroplastic [Chlorella sorokiniana]
MRGRWEAAVHILRQELTTNGQRLKDEALSEELILGLVSQVNTAAVLDALPLVKASTHLSATAIRVAAQRGSLRGVRALLRHAFQAGVALGPEGADVWRAAIVAFGQLKRPEDARQAFVDMRVRAGAWDTDDTPTVNLLLNALASDVKLQFIRARQLLDLGVKPDTSTFNCLLKACMRARDVRRAHLALQWMTQAGVGADEITYNTLVKVHSYAGDFEGVLAVWRRMGVTGFAPTAKLWGSLLVACSAAGQLEQASIFWWEMKQLHAESNGGVITTDNVCAMMTACNGAGQYERCLAAFQEAKGLGVPMDVRAYNIALRACHTPGKTLRQEQLMQAFAIYEEMKQAGLAPDTVTFGTLFSLCAAARQGHCALQLHKEMHRRKVPENVVAMTALLKAVGSTPGPTMARECTRIFRRMMRGPARVKPNQATFRVVVGALREAGELGEALRVYQAMRRLNYPADNAEFEGLTAAAAERALTAEDAELSSLVASVLQITSAREVDLHGMSVLEARAAVLCVLSMLQQQFRDTGGIAHDVTLITGRGAGSEGGEPVVRREVAALLQRLHLRLPPEGPADNPGRIVIPRQVVWEALQTKLALQRQRHASAEAGGSGADGGSSAHSGSSAKPQSSGHAAAGGNGQQ